MNNSNIAAVQAALETSIGTISEIHAVYNFENSDPSGFPFASVTFEELAEDEVFTQKANIFHAIFSIKILDEFTGKVETKDTTEDRLLSILDTALDLVRNQDYSSIGYRFRPKIKVSRPEYVTIGEGTARKIEILVELKEQIDLS